MAIIDNLRLFESTWLLIICLASYAPGKIIIQRLIRLETASRVENALFCLALGFGCLSLITLFIGLLGGLYPEVFWILLAGIIICQGYGQWYYKKDRGKENPPLPLPGVDCPQRSLLTPSPLRGEGWDEGNIIGISLLLALILLPVLILVLVPTMTYDAMVYHLAVPAKYIQAHHIYHIPYICFSNYSLNMEMLYTLGLLLGGSTSGEGDTLAKFIHLMLGLLSGAGIFCLARRHFGQAAAWFSLIVFFSIPLACFIMVQPFNDMGLTFYEIMAVYAFVNWTTTNQRSWLLVCGLMCGFAIGVKYTGGICAGILFIGVILAGIQGRQGFKPMMADLCLMIIIPLLLNLPWFIRAFVYTGNPVYPLLYPLLGGVNWSNFNHMRYVHEMTAGYGPQIVWYLKPFVCIYQLSLDLKSKLVPVCPVFLLLLPGSIIVRKSPAAFKVSAVYCLLFFLVWTYTSPVDRFFLPCAGILSVVIGYMAASLPYRRLVITFITLCCLWNSYHLCRTIWTNSYWKCLYKPAGQQLLCEQSPIDDYYSAVRYINDHLPVKSRILFIGETRSYYCQREVVVNSHLDTTIIVEMVRKSRDENDLFHRLKQQGITHILYNQTGADWLSQKFDYFHWDNSSQKEMYQRFMTGYLVPVYQKKGIVLFRLNPRLQRR